MENFELKCPVEISGLDDDKPYIELTSRLCWLDYKNLNNVGISSNAKESIESLKDMPVVAKINNSGTQFGGHEVAINDKGNVVFNTSAYGVHTDVWVSEEEVSIPNVGVKTLPCLYAKAKIWKRFSNVVELIKNKFLSPEFNNGGLWSSWELQGSEYHYDDFGGKIYDRYQFLSNCLIDVMPAYYNTSKGLQIASESNFVSELEIAYINDINKIKDKEEIITMENEIKTDDVVVASQPQVNVQVNLDETAKLLSTKEIAISGLESKIVELETKISNLENEVIEKTDALVKASEEITNLSSQVELLAPFKVAADEIAEIENQRVLSEKKEALKRYAVKGNYILEAELEYDEIIKSAIDNLDEISIKSIIADRFMKKLDEQASLEVVAPTVEVSTIEPKVEQANANINLDDESIFDAKSIMSSFLKSK